jgi:hypothetical protein
MKRLLFAVFCSFIASLSGAEGPLYCSAFGSIERDRMIPRETGRMKISSTFLMTYFQACGEKDFGIKAAEISHNLFATAKQRHELIFTKNKIHEVGRSDFSTEEFVDGLLGTIFVRRPAEDALKIYPRSDIYVAERGGKINFSPLQFAIIVGHFKMVNLLIPHQKEGLKKRDIYGNTPLEAATIMKDWAYIAFERTGKELYNKMAGNWQGIINCLRGAEMVIGIAEDDNYLHKLFEAAEAPPAGE